MFVERFYDCLMGEDIITVVPAPCWPRMRSEETRIFACRMDVRGVAAQSGLADGNLALGQSAGVTYAGTASNNVRMFSR